MDDVTEAPRGPVVERVPEGDERPRMVCDDCGFINYENPKIIVGAVVTWGDKYLLARRAIEPRKGFWTIPAGFMELNESAEAGAAREVMEEAQAEVEVGALLGVYSLHHINQVHLIYRAEMTTPDHGAGYESQEVALVDWADIPWSELAFPSVRWALEAHHRHRGETNFAPETCPEIPHRIE
ncbi:FAD pyrophosphatase [Caenispirillum salinarum AK4]|uniref:FAD pyrophosphatase n=1 Tax=Caenispirillum salinarum AK4 TaxID=1238182 RepID=K9H0G8_9PROT|nr:NUDIX hydrolase [Caenispirillum salinarum]EKV30539.1 FAD pyrophosphatase [Caenispirillum salinarum AK4]